MTSKKLFFYLALALCIIFPLLSLNNKAKAEETKKIEKTEKAETASKTKANTNTNTASQEPAPEPIPSSIVAKLNKNRELLAWLTVLDKNEINTANLMLKKTTNSKLKEYAQTIIKDHSQNLQETLKLSKEEEFQLLYTASVTDLKKDGEELGNILKPLKGNDLDKTYVGAMVNGNKNALKTIDIYLADMGPSFELESHLEATKKMLAKHLAAAQTMKDSLKASETETEKSSG